MEVLDKFNIHNRKHLFSLPVTAADPAINLLSGTFNRSYDPSSCADILW